MKTENPNFALFAGLSKKEILELHIDFLDFQVRTYNVLTAYGIKIVKDLVTFEEHQILKFKNAGWKTLTDMVAKLADVDLHFGMTPNDIDKILNEENPKILAKLEEEKEKNKAASKNKFVNITIPEELSELPIESILLYSSHFDFNQKYGTIERLKNAFTTLGDIDGHSIES
ncbi:MAG: DNA-directed RNA polymerase subunit alpha C-terminal domain-containing protein, partial [SAR202 cluster bacterium]|nr:DNA-directed RNA polymerase subunit alpha C-terminal domain-containing protein [SAR202 cluster bacterium]